MAEYTGFGNTGYDYDGIGYQSPFIGDMYASSVKRQNKNPDYSTNINRRYKNPDYSANINRRYKNPDYSANINRRYKSPSRYDTKHTVKSSVKSSKNKDLATATTLATIGIWGAYTHGAIKMDEAEFADMDEDLYNSNFEAKMKAIKSGKAYNNPRNYSLTEPFTPESSFEQDLDAILEEHEKSKTSKKTTVSKFGKGLNMEDKLGLVMVLNDFIAEVYDNEMMIKEYKKKKKFMDEMEKQKYTRTTKGSYNIKNVFYDEKKKKFYMLKDGERWYEQEG